MPRDVLTLPVNEGMPMPQKLKQYLDEREFLKMRQACNRSKTLEEFEAVVARYNDTFSIGGAVVAVQVSRQTPPTPLNPAICRHVCTPLPPSHSLAVISLFSPLPL